MGGRRLKHIWIEILTHQELTEADLSELRQLFDSEYLLKELGEWKPQQSYGYAPHDVHVTARIDGRVAFGYLGCRELVVPFYESCGGKRIVARERSVRRGGEPVVDEPGQPLLVRPIITPLELWPEGDIDLRGRAW